MLSPDLINGHSQASDPGPEGPLGFSCQVIDSLNACQNNKQ